MNKAYLLAICLLLTPLTGCLDDFTKEELITTDAVEDENNSKVDDLEDESDNTEEKELVKGCTNSTANNYNVEATEEDNTCDYDLDDDGILDADEILGCTDSTALNYNSEATDEDGTCFHFQPETKDELQTAVDEWIANSTSANSTYGEINTWDVSSVTDMSEMFYSTDSFNGNISEWDVSGVTDMYKMFQYAESFNQDISAWDVSSVTNMERMFDYTYDLSDENKCAIHTSFDSNDEWEYDWDEYCD